MAGQKIVKALTLNGQQIVGLCNSLKFNGQWTEVIFNRLMLNTIKFLPAVKG